jgi:hypothetical protein
VAGAAVAVDEAVSVLVRIRPHEVGKVVARVDFGRTFDGANLQRMRNTKGNNVKDERKIQ